MRNENHSVIAEEFGMSNKSYWIIAFVVMLGMVSMVLAGSTGKIAGVVTDAETGEPLPGVNVVIVGTNFGASTDIDGTYVILNVPPGVYTLEFSYIGYQTVRVKDVRVNVDFTTRVDQKMKATVLEGEVVEVLGEKNPLVRADLTNTQVAISSEKIDELPVDNIRDIVKLQAGITVDNSGNIHIRGGRSNEIAFQVNGLSINNPFGNTQGVGIATNAVEEVSVSAGTFSAEYGNALSGVINFVTKDGGPKYTGSFRSWIGDNVSTHKDLFFNIDEINPFNNTRTEWTFGGPIPGTNKKLTFFTSGVVRQNLGHLYGIRVYNTDDLLILDGGRILIDPYGYEFTPGPDNTIIRHTNPAKVGANGDRAIVPMVTSKALNLTGKLTWKPVAGIKLTYDIIADKGEYYSRLYFRRWRFTPDGRPKTRSTNISNSLGLIHTLSPTTFYTLKLGVNTSHALTAVYDDVFDPRYVPAVDNRVTNHIIQPTSYIAGGTDLSRAEERSISWLAKLDVVSQVHPAHEIRFGGEFAQHRLDYEAYTLLFEQINDSVGRFIIPDPTVRPEFTEYQKYTRWPRQGAFYILDKMELSKRFILNIGLRYEYFHSRAPYNPDLAGTVDKGVDRPEFLKESEPKHRVMPRISLSFPITSRGIIRFSYGIFYQYPVLRRIYVNPRFVDYNFTVTPTFGNANLDPQKSVQYEIGLQQQFTDDIKMDVTMFFKDVSNLIDLRRVIAGEVAVNKEFNVYTNIGNAKVKGFTLSFVKRRSANGIWSATLDYTFQIGMGSYTDPLALAVDTRTGRVTPQKLVPLDYDRTHTLNGTLTLTKPSSWVLSFIGSIYNGTPYTPSLPSSIKPVQYEVNSARKPWVKNVDLKFEKFFKIANGRFSLFIDVRNVFDIKNELFVWNNTGRALTNLNESINPNLFNNLKETIRANPDDFFPIQFVDNYYKREDWLSTPREVRVGLTYQF